MTETRHVDEIRVDGRHRTDLGDVQSLADSIADVGLMHPVVVTPDGRLVAGERRLAACRLVGMAEVPVRTVRGLDDASALLRAERDENTCRKPMIASELYALGKALEELERPNARERQGTRTDLATSGSTEPEVGGRTYEVVAPAVDMSAAQWKRLKHIGDQAEQGNPVATTTLEAIDDGEQTISGGYKRVRDRAPEPKRTKRPVDERADDIADLAATGHRADQIADKLGLSVIYVRKLAREHDVTLPDTVIGKTRKHDANRIVTETVATLEGVALGVDLIEVDQLDRAQVEAWATSLSTSLAPLKKLAKTLKEMAHDQDYQRQ